MFDYKNVISGFFPFHTYRLNNSTAKETREQTRTNFLYLFVPHSLPRCNIQMEISALSRHRATCSIVYQPGMQITHKNSIKLFRGVIVSYLALRYDLWPFLAAAFPVSNDSCDCLLEPKLIHHIYSCTGMSDIRIPEQYTMVGKISRYYFPFLTQWIPRRSLHFGYFYQEKICLGERGNVVYTFVFDEISWMYSIPEIGAIFFY